MPLPVETQQKPSRRPARDTPAPAPPGLSFVLIALTSALGLAGYAATLILYVAFPSFLDHVEPAIASIASRFFSGLQLYPADASTPPFGLQYGPLTYPFASLWIFLVRDAILGAKIASALAAATGVALLIRFFFRTGAFRLALVVAGTVAWWLLFLKEVSFWARPDPYLLLAVCLGVTSNAIRSPRRQAIALGLLLGLAMGLKIHAALAFLPLFGLLWHRQGFPALFLSGVLGIAAIFLPFAFPSVSLGGYLKGLEFASRHGFSLELFRTVSLCALLLVAPVALCLRAAFVTNASGARAELRNHWAFWLSLPLSLALALVVASKSGAGPGHLVAFVPLLGYALFRLGALVRTAPSAPKRWFALSPCRWVALYAPILVAAAIYAQYPIWARCHAGWQANAVIREDLRNILETTGTFRVAIGPGNRNYSVTYVRAELIRQGHPYVLEPAALMDLQFAAVPIDTATILDSPEVDIWLFPRDTQPFALGNFYQTGFVLPLDLQVKFLQRWERKGQTGAFDLWIRRTAGEAGTETSGT